MAETTTKRESTTYTVTLSLPADEPPPSAYDIERALYRGHTSVLGRSQVEVALAEAEGSLDRIIEEAGEDAITSAGHLLDDLLDRALELDLSFGLSVEERLRDARARRTERTVAELYGR